MKLKKTAVMLTLTLTTTLLSALPVSAHTNIYDVPNLKYEMTIPNGYYAMQRDSSIDDGKLASMIGAPGANFTPLVKHQIMMIDSKTYEAKGEYLLLVAKSDFTNRVQNFLNKSEDYLSKEWTSALGTKKYYNFEFYQHPEARFVHTRSEYDTDMFENYITVKNGLYYMLSYRYSGDYSETAQNDLLKKLVDSIHFTSHDVIVQIDGNGLDFTQRPVMYGNNTMVPLRTIFEALGATVKWDGATKTITSTKDSTTISLQIDNKQLRVNDKTIELDAPAILYNSTTMVPARAVAEAFGYNVGWDSSARIVKITTK